MKVNYLLIMLTMTFFSIFSNAFSGSITSYEDELKKYGVEISKDGLKNGLNHEEKKVRWLSAYQIAERGYADFIRILVDLLKRDSDPENQLNIGYAVALMGDNSGIQALKKLCKDANNFQIAAIRYLLHFNEFGCLENLFSALEATSDEEIWNQALFLLPEVPNFVSSEYKKVSILIGEALLNRQPSVKVSAVGVIHVLSIQDAILHLNQAILEEKDDTILSVMKEKLRILKDS